MSVTNTSAFKHSARISRAKWHAVLDASGTYRSPLWNGVPEEDRRSVADAMYDRIVAAGHDPAIWLAIGVCEHSLGANPNSVLNRNDTRSWTNARSVRDPSLSGWKVIRDDVRRSQYVKYQTVVDSLQDGLYRVDEPGYPYRAKNAVSIIDHTMIWTEGDGPQYAAKMVNLINQWMAEDTGDPPMAKPTIALAAGHHNTSGGNATEHEQVGRLTPAIAKALRERGIEVRSITPNDGAGHFPGTLSDVARQVKATDDVFLEVHTEGNGAGDAGRGVFAIYPDWGNDVDTDVRDNLGPALARAIRDATGIPLRGNGVMSEKSTGVGGQGHRLGVFAITEPLKASVTRLLIEYGSHSSPADMARWAAPGFVERAAAATANVIALYLGLQSQPAPEPEPEPPADDRILVDGNPFGAFGYALGFKGRLQQIGAAVSPSDPHAGILAWAGYPREDEWRGTDGCTYQRTERLILKYEPGVAAPFDIVARLRNSPALPERAS